jgi:hypothetical protein
MGREGMGQTKPGADIPGDHSEELPVRPSTADDKDSFPPGVDGIDVHRVLEPFAELEIVASELGWGAVLRILADLVDGRDATRRSIAPSDDRRLPLRVNGPITSECP